MREMTRIVLLGIGFVSAATSLVHARTWTDRAGRQIEADFLGFSDGKVEIKRKSDGKQFHVLLERFSDGDQAFVRSQKKAMDAAFNAGKAYFVWTTQPEPITASFHEVIGTTASFADIRVMARSPTQAPNFRIHIAVEATDAETKGVSCFTTTTSFPATGNTYEAGARYWAVFIAREKLTGSGVARRHLIPADGEPKDATPISNTVQAKVDCK